MDEAMLSAVSGIDGNQTWLNTIGDNIANANTTGFKQDVVDFGSLLAQQIQGAAAPNGVGLGGVNATGVGTGVKVDSITPDLSAGSLQQTSDPTDVFINGNGYLIANVSGTTLYTRDGTLLFDASGNLVTPTGGLVQGWQAGNGGAAGKVNTSLPPTGISIPANINIQPQLTQNVFIGGNLPAASAAGTVVGASGTIYDAQGNALQISLQFTAGAANSWSMTGTITGSGGYSAAIAASTITFNGTGNLSSPLSVNVAGLAAHNGAAVGPISINFFPSTTNGTADLTQFGGSNAGSVNVVGQDGIASGALAALAVNSSGVITGSFTNGQNVTLGQLALATFANPTGLNRVGNNMWQQTPNSGLALVNTPGSGGAGSLTAGALEASNVDMARNMTNIVIAQTSYTANTRVVTAETTDLNSLFQSA